MKYEIKLQSATFSSLELMPENESGKRWSYSFVYSLVDLRNIAIVLSQKVFICFKDIVDYCNNTISLTTEKGRVWTIRSIEEVINALRNFDMVEQGKFTLTKNASFNPFITPSLTDTDVNTFKGVFFNYFRFRDFLKLYEEDTLVFSYIENGRFVNRFFIENDTIDVKCIPQDRSDTMRFWDVFIKWGGLLGVLEKYPAKPFGIVTDSNTRSLSISYKVKPMPEDFSPFEYAANVIKASFIYIPDLVFCIIKQYQYPLNSILDRLIYECKYSDLYRAQCASSIFIKQNEEFLIPKINNTYYSHLLKL